MRTAVVGVDVDTSSTKGIPVVEGNEFILSALLEHDVPYKRSYSLLHKIYTSTLEAIRACGQAQQGYKAIPQRS